MLAIPLLLFVPVGSASSALTCTSTLFVLLAVFGVNVTLDGISVSILSTVYVFASSFPAASFTRIFPSPFCVTVIPVLLLYVFHSVLPGNVYYTVSASLGKLLSVTVTSPFVQSFGSSDATIPLTSGASVSIIIFSDFPTVLFPALSTANTCT